MSGLVSRLPGGLKRIGLSVLLFLIPALAFVLAPWGLVYAGEASSTSIITLDEAYRRAVLGHEDVQIAGEDVVIAQKGVRKADSEFFPTISAEGTYQKFTTTKRVSGFLLQPDNSREFDLLVSQPIFNGGSSWHGRKAALLSVRKSEEGRKEAGENIMLGTARAFFDVLKAQKEVDIEEAALERAKSRRDVASARFEVGEVTRSDLLRAESEVAGAEAALISAKSALRNARSLFRRFVPVEGDFTLQDPGITADPDLDTKDLVSIAYKNRLDLTETELDKRIAQMGVKQAWAGFLPSLRVDGLYSRRDRDPTTSFLLKESISATVVLTYPLFEGGLRVAEMGEARARERIEGLRLRSLKKDIVVQVRQAYNNVREKEAVIMSLERRLKFARENYRMVFEQFKNGVATSVDVTDANAELLRADRSLKNARFDLEVAVVELKFAMGTLHNEI